MLKGSSIIGDSVAFCSTTPHAVDHLERLGRVLWLRSLVEFAVTLKKVRWSRDARESTVDGNRATWNISVAINELSQISGG